MAQPTTLQKAKSMMDKLVSMKINKSPLPLQTQRIFPVASLTNGNLLLSNGETRQTPVMQNLAKIQEQRVFGGQEKKNPMDYLSTLALNIAVPAKQTGQDATEQIAMFAKYIGDILKPKLAAPAEAGLPAMVPKMEDKLATFQAPSALANLPKLSVGLGNVAAQNKNMFDDFLKSTEKFQETLRQDYMKMFERGESETNRQRFGQTSLVQGYGNGYRLPSASDANYAKVSANPFVLTSQVR